MKFLIKLAAKALLLIGAVALTLMVFAAPASALALIDPALTTPEFVLPVIPVSILVVLQFVSPYLVSIITNISASAATKRLIAVATSFVLAAGILVVSWFVGWIPQDTTPLGILSLLLLGLGVQQAAYGLILKPSADALMEKSSE